MLECSLFSSYSLVVVMIKQRLVEYTRLTRLDRPIGIYLVLWPTLWGLWLAAEGWPIAEDLAAASLTKEGQHAQEENDPRVLRDEGAR